MQTTLELMLLEVIQVVSVFASVFVDVTVSSEWLAMLGFKNEV